MTSYTEMTEHKAKHMDGAKAWAMYHWARVNRGSVWGSGERPVDNYVRQEIERRMKSNG